MTLKRRLGFCSRYVWLYCQKRIKVELWLKQKCLWELTDHSKTARAWDVEITCHVYKSGFTFDLFVCVH